MKLVLESVLVLVVLGVVQSNQIDQGHFQNVEESLKKGFVNLPFGYGMIILPNFTQHGGYTDLYFGSTYIDLKTNLVVLRGLESATTNKECVTNTNSYRTVARCNFTVPNASLQVVGHIHIGYQYFGGFNKDLDHRHFIGIPTTPLTGTFSFEKVNSPKVMDFSVTGVKVNPVLFNFGKASTPKEQAIHTVLQKYGPAPDARLTYPLEYLLPPFIQNGLNM